MKLSLSKEINNIYLCIIICKYYFILNAYQDEGNFQSKNKVWQMNDGCWYLHNQTGSYAFLPAEKEGSRTEQLNSSITYLMS